MRKLSMKLLLLLAVIGVSVMIPFMTLYATELKPSVSLTSSNGVSDLVSLVNSYTGDIQSGFEYLSYTVSSSGGVIVSVDTYTYNELNVADKQKVMSNTLSCISDSSLVAIDRTKLYNFVSETDSAVSAVVRQLSADGKTDFYTAYSYIKPFSGTLGTILALIAIGLFAGLLASTLLDLAYLAIPVFNVFLSSGVKDNEKPKMITVEAFSAYIEGVGSADKSSNKDLLLLYIGKKWKQFVIIALCVLYLTSGLIWGLIADVIDLFSGFLS